MTDVFESQVEPTPISAILTRIVLAFRIAGWLWLLLLVIGAYFSDDLIDSRISFGTAFVTGMWTIFTVWIARDPERLGNVRFVVADGVVAVGAAIASYASGSESTFHGGYPISWIAVVAFAGTMWWAVAAGGVLFVTQWVGMSLVGSHPLNDKLGAIVFLIYGLILGYTFDILRDRDRLRAAAENERAVAEAELADERARKVRNEEQAHLADQLHDSVLQTLTAIRSASGHPEQVTYLVRRQERELRKTIHQLRSQFEHSFGTLMYAARDDVEDLYDIEIEMLCVFDEEVDAKLQAVVDATREALVNAAKHSGSKTADVYCGRENGALEAYIRDRGRGFDAANDGGGFGLKNSIQRRIADVGGSTAITSSPDMGTEVYISVPLP
jgi:signal transduction histidine kinase